MTHGEFLMQMDEILGLPAGTVRADERLEELENWDSTALISFIVLVETSTNASISPDQIVTCSTVADLLRLAQIEGGETGRGGKGFEPPLSQAAPVE